MKNYVTAFPHDQMPGLAASTGMSLRDYFAAAALQGLIACCSGEVTFPRPDNAAQMAYEYADAMIEKREQ